MTPSFNVGRTQNIGASAFNLANPGILASNNQLDALNKLAIARMNTQQGFAGLRNKLSQEGADIEMQQSQPTIFDLASLGLSGANAINARDARNKTADFYKLNNAGFYNPMLQTPEVNLG